MKATEALADLRRLGKPVLTTEDAALRLKATLSAASRLLARLSEAGLVRRLRHGLWSLEPDLDPLLLPEYLTAPYPAYVSFQSALYFHGMISQIPRVVYVASLSRTRRVTTSLGTYSIHRLAPSFFGGYETLPDSGIRLAGPEKSLLDTLYLSPARSRLFAHLTELELPGSFSVLEARRWLARISAPYRRTMVARRLDEILASRGTPG
jgi:predicted transcriptional regulator of viral defense system